MNQKSIAVKLLLNAKSGVVRQRMSEPKVVFAEPIVDLSFIGLCFSGGTLVLAWSKFHAPSSRLLSFRTSDGAKGDLMISA
jgi:hypothetical protein